MLGGQPSSLEQVDEYSRCCSPHHIGRGVEEVKCRLRYVGQLLGSHPSLGVMHPGCYQVGNGRPQHSVDLHGHRRNVDLGDFGRIDGCEHRDDVAPADNRVQVREFSEHGHGAGIQPDLFVSLTNGSLVGRLIGVDAASRKAHFAGMARHRERSPGEQHFKTAFTLSKQHQNRREPSLRLQDDLLAFDDSL